MEARIAEIRERLRGVTEGPWFVWDGIGYFGGGRDLCIGAGPTWLANMDHRTCDNREMHHFAADMLRQSRDFAEGRQKCAPEGDTRIMSVAQTCEIDEQFTAEQIADANFIARAREDVPFLLATIAYLDKANDELQTENFRLRHPDFADEASEAL